jgi:hypothetical protein
MVVESVALPKVSGTPGDPEPAVAPGETAMAPIATGRSLHAPVFVPLLVVLQTAWLGLLGYAALRFLL